MPLLFYPHFAVTFDFFWLLLVYLNSLTAIGGRDRQLFNELRARVVSPRIFVRYQRLMA